MPKTYRQLESDLTLAKRWYHGDRVGARRLSDAYSSLATWYASCGSDRADFACKATTYSTLAVKYDKLAQGAEIQV